MTGWLCFDADPSHDTYDGHGTMVAGVAAAVANNSAGVAGVAGKCKILPVRMIYTDSAGAKFAAASTAIYRALIYAANNADVINCSWSATVDGLITSGLSYAHLRGRGGKGCPIFVAAGNTASGSGPLSWDHMESVDIFATPGLGAGKYYVEFRYVKDGSTVLHDDTLWLAEVGLPLDGGSAVSIITFDSPTFPAGWNPNAPGSSAAWTLGTDPAHTHGTTRYALRPGAIGHNQESRLRTPLLDITAGKPSISYRRWMSCDQGDRLHIAILNQSGTFMASAILGGGQVNGKNAAVYYPGTLSTVAAVGASSDLDYRSDYSTFGSQLAFVAPSTGGFATYGSLVGEAYGIVGIPTTDRTGAAGYVPQDYFFGGGTSVSAPAAAGIAALILSKDASLTKAAVLQKMKDTCAKVGPVAYTGTAPTRNDYYGHGRLNAKAALDATTADTTAPTVTSAFVSNFRAVDVTFSEAMGDNVLDTTKYQITAGQGTLGANPAKVIRILPTVYRLVWTSGDMATSGTVTISFLAGIKDAAGNALAATTKNSTGTSKIIGINCGNNHSSYQLYGLQYIAGFDPDNGFLGNEPAFYLTGTTGTSSYTTATIYTSGVPNAGPQEMYQTIRNSWGSTVTITYQIPNIPAGNKTVRLHFAEQYYNNIGDARFDIVINGVTIVSNFDILAATGGYKNKAYTLDITQVPPSGGVITAQFVPKAGNGGVYNAHVSGIEILKP